MLNRLPSEKMRTSKLSSPYCWRRIGSLRLTCGWLATAMPISARLRARPPKIAEVAMSMSKAITRNAVMLATARIAISQSTAIKAAPRLQRWIKVPFIGRLLPR